ncbi:hypothetical protein ABPG72_010850 [Tetrahymena utriculariae]
MQKYIYFFFFVFIIKKLNCSVCPVDQCFSKDKNICLDIIQNSYTGKSFDGNCVNDGEQSQIEYCVVLSNKVCINKLQTMCIMLNDDPNSNFIGSYYDTNQILTCIEGADVQSTSFDVQTIQQLNPEYCYQNNQLIYNYMLPSKIQIIGVYIYKNLYRCALITDVNQPLPQSSKIYYLQNNYCFYQENQIVDISDASKQIVGITKLKSCVIINIPIGQFDEIDSCVSGYCIFLQNCVQLNGKNYISKLQNNKCGGDSQTNFKECFASIQTSPLTCIQNSTCELITQQKPIVGVKVDFQCINQDEQLVDQKQIQFCSKFHCIQQIIDLSGHNQQLQTNFSCQIEINGLGEDSKGNCQQLAQLICIQDDECLYIDPTNNQQICMKLSPQINSPFFAKEIQTTQCLRYQTIKDSGQNIDKCPEGFCIYEQSDLLKYCVNLGDYFYGQLFIGRELFTQNCLKPLEPSVLGIEECYSNQYCIFQQDNIKLCHPLMYTSLYFQNRNDVKAKGQDGGCLDLNMPNSISCLIGDYCLLNGVCVELSNQNQNQIGRNQDQSCIFANTYAATNCALGYCLLNYQCIQLSFDYPGREDITENCLQEQETKFLGAKQCHSSYCLLLGQTQNMDTCVSLNYRNPFQIGIYKESGVCVSENDQNIPHQDKLVLINYLIYLFKKNIFFNQTCFQGVYCINTNQNGEYCQKIEGDIICSDNQGRCISKNSTTQCYRCSFSQCLQNGVCIALNNQFCQDNKGCSVCPLEYCLQQQQGQCLPQNWFVTSNYTESECLLNYRQDQKCLRQNINWINQFQINICKDKNNICQVITANDKQNTCLICPQNFVNPGNNQCYQRTRNMQNSYFGFELSYIQEDCYPNSDCSQEGSQKCPEGCRNCLDQNTCTLCQENYFLFFDSQTQKQICLMCDIQVYEQMVDPISQLFRYVNKLQFQCAECNIEANQWANSQYLQKICTQMVVNFAGTKYLSRNFRQSLHYLIQKTNQTGSNFKIIRILQPAQCQSECLSCDIDLQGKARCIKCKYFYYVNSDYQCAQCPQGCLECGMKIDQNYVNSKIFGLAVYPSNKLNKYCLKCNQGYTLDFFSRFDCFQFYSSYCQNSDQLANSNKHSKTYFQYRADRITDYVKTDCFNCYYGCLYNSNCIKFVDYPSIQTGSYSCQGTYLKCTYYYQKTNKCWSYETYGYGTMINYSQKDIPLIMKSPPRTIDMTKRCSQIIQNCINCLEFTDYQDGLLYQCIECKQGFIPSISLCIPCPDGCQSCFEAGYLQNDRVNFTNIFVNERDIISKFTFQQRISYKQTFNINMLCSDCLDGRKLNSNSTSCDLPKCGNFCSKCIFYLDEPLCIQSSMYFNSDYLREIYQLVTYDSQQQNCKLCPMLCETCEDRTFQFDQIALDFYQTKCFTCKQQVKSQYLELQRYEIRYDKQRQKCQLCLIGDKGCYFKKVSKIYVFCGDQSQQLGKGTIEDPYNIFKFSGSNIDQLILNEPDFMRALVFYNELQLRKVEMVIEYVDQNHVCYENIQLTFYTNLKMQIYSLEHLSLTIRANQTSDYQNFVIHQIKSANITGFNKITIENIDFIQKQMENTFGLEIYEKLIDSITITNSSFSQISSMINLFSFRVQTLNGQMAINNLQFKNIKLLNSKLINIQFIESSFSLKYDIKNLIIQSCSFVSSLFLELQSPGVINMENLQLLNSNLTQSSTLIKALLNGQNILQISDLNINQFICSNSNIFNSSILINALNFQSTYLNGVLVYNNLIIAQNQNTKAMLFNMDFLNITDFNFKQNNLIDTVIFSLSSTNNLQNENAILNLTTFKFQENKILTQNSVIFELELNSKVKVFLNDFIIKDNIHKQFNQQNLNRCQYFYFLQINQLLVQNVLIQGETIPQFTQVQSSQSINVNQFIVGSMQKVAYSSNILDFQSLNTTCIITNAQFYQLVSYQNLVQIYQIKNKIETNNKIIYQIQFINITLQGLQQNSYLDIKLNYEVQSFININSHVDGSILLQNFHALNISKCVNQNTDKNIDVNRITSSIWINNQVGYLSINDSIFTSQYYSQKHYMLYIASAYVNFKNTTFEQQSDNLIQQSSLKGGLAQVNSQVLNVFNSTFTGGIAFQGGAIYWIAIDQAKMLIDKSQFVNNTSKDSLYFKECYGGAIFIDITLSKFTSQIFILNSDFQNNLSLSKYGQYIFQSLQANISWLSEIVILQTTLHFLEVLFTHNKIIR